MEDIYRPLGLVFVSISWCTAEALRCFLGSITFGGHLFGIDEPSFAPGLLPSIRPEHSGHYSPVRTGNTFWYELSDQ
jgi:hypothetical protein